jgi:5-hydroxyisourate hydrolase
VPGISTHVLDNALGRPAGGVPVALWRLADSPDPAAPAGEPVLVAEAVTDADGRVARLGEPGLPPGGYRLVFDTGAYFAAIGQAAFYPEVAVSFLAAEADGHYHVPLLLSPFAYATYRGS